MESKNFGGSYRANWRIWRLCLCLCRALRPKEVGGTPGVLSVGSWAAQISHRSVLWHRCSRMLGGMHPCSHLTTGTEPKCDTGELLSRAMEKSQKRVCNVSVKSGWILPPRPSCWHCPRPQVDFGLQLHNTISDIEEQHMFDSKLKFMTEKKLETSYSWQQAYAHVRSKMHRMHKSTLSGQDISQILSPLLVESTFPPLMAKWFISVCLGKEQKEVFYTIHLSYTGMGSNELDLLDLGKWRFRFLQNINLIFVMWKMSYPVKVIRWQQQATVSLSIRYSGDKEAWGALLIWSRRELH